MSSIPSTSSAPPHTTSPPNPPPPTTMASKWFKQDPPGTSKPMIRPLNDTLAVAQAPIPDPKPVYVPYIPPPAKNSSSKKATKSATSDKNPTKPVEPSVPYMHDLPRITGNATKTREGYEPKVISDKYPDPLAAYLPKRTPTIYTPPNPFLQLNRFSKKSALEPSTTTSPAPKPKKLPPMRTAAPRGDEPEEIVPDTRPSSPLGTPHPVIPPKPRGTFVAPNVPDKPVYAMMAKIRDRNPLFESQGDNHPKTALKRPHQQWEPRWDSPQRDARPSHSFPSTSSPEKSSKRRGKSPKRPARRSRRELLQGECTEFVPYEPIDADFDTDFKNFMLRQPRFYESDNFNFDFTKRRIPNNWKPDLTVFDCVAAELERDLEERISGRTRQSAGREMEFDDLDNYDAHNMFDFPKISGTADDFEHAVAPRPRLNDNLEIEIVPPEKKKSKKTVEEDEHEDAVETSMGLITGVEMPKKKSKTDITGMKFPSPPPFRPELRGVAYVKSRKIQLPKEPDNVKATIELPKNCKLFQYTWTNNGKTQNILVPMSSTATHADVEKLMPEILKVPENMLEMTKLEEKNMVLGLSDVDPPPPPPPPIDPNQPVLVNPKQYHRIMERRKMRFRQEARGTIPINRQDYMHESRHNHATKRKRMGDGRFEKDSDEEEEEEENDVVVLEDSEDENEPNVVQKAERTPRPYLPVPLRSIRPDPLKKSFKRKPKPPKPHEIPLRWAHLVKPVPLRSVPVPPSGTPLGQDAPVSRYYPSPVVTKIPSMAARSSNRPMAPVGGGAPPVKRTMFPLRPPAGPSSASTTTDKDPAQPSSSDPVRSSPSLDPTLPDDEITLSNQRAPSESLSEAPAEDIAPESEEAPRMDHSRLLLTRIGNAPKEYPTPVSVFIPRLPPGANPNSGDAEPDMPRLCSQPKSALIGQPEPADRPKAGAGSAAAPYCPQGRWTQFSSEAQEKMAQEKKSRSQGVPRPLPTAARSTTLPVKSNPGVASTSPNPSSPRPVPTTESADPNTPQRELPSTSSAAERQTLPNRPFLPPHVAPHRTTSGAASTPSNPTVPLKVPSTGSSTLGAFSTPARRAVPCPIPSTGSAGSSTPETSNPSAPRPVRSTTIPVKLTPGAASTPSNQAAPRPVPTTRPADPNTPQRQLPSTSSAAERQTLPNRPFLPPHVAPHRMKSAPTVIRSQVYCKETGPRLEQKIQTIRARTVKGGVVSMSPAQYEQCKARVLAARREKERATAEKEKTVVDKEIEIIFEKKKAVEKTVVEETAVEQVVEKVKGKELEKEKAVEKTVVEKAVEKEAENTVVEKALVEKCAVEQTVVKKVVEKEVEQEKSPEIAVVENEAEKTVSVKEVERELEQEKAVKKTIVEKEAEPVLEKEVKKRVEQNVMEQVVGKASVEKVVEKEVEKAAVEQAVEKAVEKEVEKTVLEKAPVRKAFVEEVVQKEAEKTVIERTLVAQVVDKAVEKEMEKEAVKE